MARKPTTRVGAFDMANPRDRAMLRQSMRRRWGGMRPELRRPTVRAIGRALKALEEREDLEGTREVLDIAQTFILMVEEDQRRERRVLQTLSSAARGVTPQVQGSATGCAPVSAKRPPMPSDTPGGDRGRE